MYNEYFGFNEAPFSIAPDPRYLYMTSQHRDALAHLVYGLNSEGGCILLTGEVGTGKTTICRCLLEQIPNQANVALVLNPKVNEIELLETICDELNISYPDSDNSLKTYTDRIYSYLIESNRNNEKTVLIIDEAQNLDSKVLEQLRLLTNLETHQRKLLQIIILGQPELLDILATTEMRQLAQRITARFHLNPLTKQELKAYISHRLAVAGQNSQLFPDSCINLLFKLSNGVPRLINILCDRALLGAYVENQNTVNPIIVKKASKEVFGELKNVEQQQKNKRLLYPIAILGSFSIIVIVALALYSTAYDPNVIYVQMREKPEAIIDDTIVEFPAEPERLGTTQKDEIAKILIRDVEQHIEEPKNTNTSAAVTNKKYADIKDILNDTKNNSVSAYKKLFSIWGERYNTNTSITACKQAEAFSLNCLYKQGNINSLKIHNRPAVLTLINPQGKTLYITITSIDDDLAIVYSNETEYVIRLEDLDEYWYGQFILLWHKPEHYTTAIVPGRSGNIINWLSTQLTKINNLSSTNIVTTYDGSIVESVKTFQAEQKLTADGIVGPVTIIHLNTRSGIDSPLLIQAPLTTAIN